MIIKGEPPHALHSLPRLLRTLAMSVLPRSDFITVAISSILFSFILFVWYSAKKRPSYPPGPKRLPIVGNLLSMPSHEEWVTYRKWSDQFGMTPDTNHV